MAAVRLELSSGKSIDVTIERAGEADARAYVARLPDRTCLPSVCAYDGDRGFVVTDHRIQRYCTLRRGDHVEVWVNGVTHHIKILQRTAKRHGAAEQAGPAGDIVATMPGTVLKIEVAEGDQFAAHQPLVIMESMKMEMTLSSPRSGRVKEIACRSGQLVEIGALLIRLETDET